MSDLYNILGVDRNANEEQIKKAYRKKAMEFHPDRNPGNPEAEVKFKEAAEAYDTLSDPNKKSNYDRFGSGGNPFGGGHGHGFDMNDIFSQFGDIFGGAFNRTQKRQSKGTDLRIKVTLNIQDILNGCDKKLKYKRHDKCNSCNGKGGENVTNCGSCNGRGSRIISQITPFGEMQQEVNCQDCRATGKVVKDKCGQCNGEGTKVTDQVVDVTIPAGVSNGMQLNMQSYGNHTRDGIPGDLFIIIEEEINNSYKRENNNIIIDKTISVIDAIIGSNIKVETPHGEISLNIEPGTEHGKVSKINGKGIPDINYGLGDLYIRLSIKIPKNIELDEQLILEKLKKSKNFEA